MYTGRVLRREKVLCSAALLVFAIGLLPAVSLAAPPVVKTVPWVANNPLIPHDTWSGKSIRLKGTSNVQGTNIRYTWDFGDGSPVATATVTNMYAIEAAHAYTGSAGTVFTATLTVQNTTSGETGSRQYYVKIEDKTLAVEVNVAIDEGLWWLHKNQQRSGSEGYWTFGSYGSYYSTTASSVNAFEVNGHLETGSPDNPYTETVSRGMRRLFTYLGPYSISSQTSGNPDSNGNGIGIYVPQGYSPYQGGMFIDAIIASGTPDATAPTGVANVIGRKYKDIVQDMVDFYAFAQYDYAASPYGRLGGWRYNANDAPDNSACQWAAIGLIPAERNWGLTIPTWVKTNNLNWLSYSQDTYGRFGYTSATTFVHGPFGTTPSGMVQLAMDGKGRGDSRWDKAERYLRDNFGSTNPSDYYNIKRFYYGLFSFVKSMLTHDSNGDLVAEPIKMLQSSSADVNPIDWYAAEVNPALPLSVNNTVGVARQLVSDQTAAGNWPGQSYAIETPWVIIMLQRTLFQAGAPVAVATATPNPAVAGQTIQLDGSTSFHQDASKIIDSWEWDLDNDGEYDDASGPFASVSFPALGSYPVGLRVTDNAVPESAAETTLLALVTIPPVAPTADAGGPYNLCPGAKPWYLDGTGSVNPDEGESEPHDPPYPGDTIAGFTWDLDGDGAFDDASGVLPEVTSFFEGKGPGSYLIQLKTTDTTSASFPSSGSGNLSDTDTAVVTVRAASDPECGCVDNLTARAKPGKVQLVWTYTGAHHYNVYRGTIPGGPYLLIAKTTSTYSTYLDLAVVNGTTYYYVVREANFLDQESCQSNEASARPVAR